MKAMLLSDHKQLVLTELPVPPIGEDDVLVRVRACGICGSDIHGYDGSTGRRLPPVVMGHEAAGVVERAGKNVRDLRPGDRVALDSTITCGECEYCRDGRSNLCDARTVLGVSCADYRRDGAFAEYVAVPARSAHRIPDGLSFERAALVEPLSVAAHAAGRAERGRRGTAVVVGAGMIGQLLIQVLRELRYDAIIAVDVELARLELARRCGAAHMVDARGTDVPRAVAELTGGAGADTAFEVVGHAGTLESAVRSLRKGGTAVLVGNVSPKIEMPLQDVVSRELSLLGSCAASNEIPAAIDMLASGSIDADALTGLVAPLEEGPAIFERLHRGAAGVMKVILQP